MWARVCYLLVIFVVFFFLVLGMGWDWIHLVRRPLLGLLLQHQMINDDVCEAVGGMRIGRGNRSTRRKLAQAPLCPTQIPHDLTWDRTRAAVLGSRQLTTWAMAQSCYLLNFDSDRREQESWSSGAMFIRKRNEVAEFKILATEFLEI
jgi:hypothetical protein